MFFTGFTQALLSITLFELGDKTFLIGALLAMKYPRRWVFLGALIALIAMTVLSVGLGQVATLLPEHLVKITIVVLFASFGLKLLYDAWRMSPQADSCDDELEAAQTAIAAAASNRSGLALPTTGILAILIETCSLVFVAEWGDRTQFTTITLSAQYPLLSVISGGIVGHAICAAIAVFSGKWICRWLSERVLLAIGGILFLIFAAVAGLDR